ncbi:hypothetical protein [Nonomuraea sp. NEAU-A123]|uniref:hypothetical protein n=1 Tax=Nonomuraea sp. NEAU-A123 TaxID=2839649 RepID=UPI001BE411E3|nr:hypothetical protein [Nonomuraea sp. NEAU-A123]MBT2226255.1 hypothetical protein [Nonomuraea sp. NEAU-A123]
MTRFIDESKITAEQARHVLFHFRSPGGFQGGDYTTDLVNLIARSSPTNRARFAEGFAGYVSAVNLAQHVEGGTAKLQAIAAGKTFAVEISEEDAAHVLFHARGEGWTPSTFRKMLLAAMDTGDAHNLDKLAAGFPGLVTAYRMVRTLEGLDKLRAIVGENA